MMSRSRMLGVLLILVMALLVCPVAVPPIAAAPAAQSGTLTILFNADTRPQVPISQYNPFPHEGIHMTCSLLGSESSVYLQLTVDGILVQQEQCDGTIEWHGLFGHVVDISAQDFLGIGPVFHLIVYGTDLPITPTVTGTAGPTATPAGLPFGCTTPGGVPFGYYAHFVLAGHYTSNLTNSPLGGFAFPLPDNTNAGFVSVQWVNATFAGFAGRYNLFDAPGGTLLESVDMHVNQNPLGRWAAVGDYVTFSTLPGYTAGPVEADFCFWYYYPVTIPSPTPVGASTNTPTPSTPTVTGTMLPTAPPTYGQCVLVHAQLTGAFYTINANGDFYQRQWRIELGELPIQFSAVFDLGSASVEIDHREWQAVQVHTRSVAWLSNLGPFSIRLCLATPIISTIVPTVNILTPTVTRTPIPTRTGTITPSTTPSPTNTGTPLPTSTPPGSCATPGSEDEAECAILELLKTPPVIETPVPLSTPVPNIATAVAVICERDPCASAGDVTDTIGELIVILEASSHAPNCLDFRWPPGFGGSTWFQVPEQDFAVGFCAFLDMSVTLRAWMRVLSVFFFAMIGVKYYLMTMRRVGDV